MCICSVLINNHCPIIYHYNSQVLIFHTLFCLLALAWLSSAWWKRVQLRKSEGHIVTELRKTAWTDPCLLLGSGKWTACGSSHPARQQPPHLYFPSQHHASNCLWPSALAPSSAQQWTLKPAGGVWGGPYFYHTDGRIIAAQDHVAALLLLHMNSNSVFYSCVFTCNTHPPATGSCRVKQSVLVCVVVAIKKKKVKSTAFVRKLSNCFHFYKLLWTYNAYMYNKKTCIRCSLSTEVLSRHVVQRVWRKLRTLCVIYSHSATDLLEHQGLKYHFPWLR